MSQWMSSSSFCWINRKVQCTYNAKMWCLCKTIVVVKPNKYYIFWVGVCSLSNPTYNAQAPYCYLWPVRFYGILLHYLNNGQIFEKNNVNPLNAELNPICCLLALLGTHHLLHVSRIRVKTLTLRLLMSYIYGAPILDVSRSHTTTHHIR